MKRMEWTRVSALLVMGAFYTIASGQDSPELAGKKSGVVHQQGEHSQLAECQERVETLEKLTRNYEEQISILKARIAELERKTKEGG